jgi:hypothetical protein
MKYYKEIPYQSTYEHKFLKYIDELGYLHLIDRGPKIIYEYNGVNHTYFSDFCIKNTDIVFEIKSKYTWDINLDVNIAKKVEAEKKYKYYIIINNDFSEIKEILKGYEKI